MLTTIDKMNVNEYDSKKEEIKFNEIKSNSKVILNNSIDINKFKNNILKMNNPIISYMIELGIEPIYSFRIFQYYSPKNNTEAIEYLIMSNGIIQHHFVVDRNKKNINICYLCGGKKEEHLDYFSEKENDINSNNINNNIEQNNTNNNIMNMNKNNNSVDISKESININKEEINNISCYNNDNNNSLHDEINKSKISDNIKNDEIKNNDTYSIKNKSINKNININDEMNKSNISDNISNNEIKNNDSYSSNNKIINKSININNEINKSNISDNISNNEIKKNDSYSSNNEDNNVNNDKNNNNISENINIEEIKNNNSFYSNNINNNISNKENKNNISEKIKTDNSKNNISFYNHKEIEQITCEICTCLFNKNNENTLEKCGHSFCNECWYVSLSVKIYENKLTSIKCLKYECDEKLSDNFIINLLNSDITLINKYKKFKLELEIINNPNKKFCPIKNCNSFGELKDKDNNYVKCLNGHIFCFLCLKEYHGDSPCPRESLHSMEEYAKNFFIKKCPNCGIVTEKNSGCNHITCSKCSYQWCWLCNEKYDPEHYNIGKCKDLQFYKPKDENEIQLVFEGKIKPQINDSFDDFFFL